MSYGKQMQQMVKGKIFFLISILSLVSTFAQVDHFKFKQWLSESPTLSMPFAVPFNKLNLNTISSNQAIKIKAITQQWIYIQTTPVELLKAVEQNKLLNFHIETDTPQALADSSRINYHVEEVHKGLGGLNLGFTGKDVIIGYIDQGLDWTHGDFLDEKGQSRVLYYWDHTVNDPARTPSDYGYGQVWYPNDFKNKIVTSNELGTAHGTTVTGAGSSNGRATGNEKGMAPDSKIIVVESNLGLPNWTLTIADACDFIFKKADSLNMPAVINISLGIQLGSHDGNDPAAEYLEQLVSAKNGRIIVCAAGNSGGIGKYHVQGKVKPIPNYVWLKPNPNHRFGKNCIYMDLWTELSDANWEYSFRVHKKSGDFADIGGITYRQAKGKLDGVIYDSIMIASKKYADVEIYPSVRGNSLHLEMALFADSSNYYYGFYTKGSGKYDAWTGSAAYGLTDMEDKVPSPTLLPSIVNYTFPDTLQTLFDSWICSEKIVTVGNVRNRLRHIDGNGNIYNGTFREPGRISGSSSKGPTRLNVVKPDVSAPGDLTLTAAPSWLTNNPGYNSTMSLDKKHARNGGTSMASPHVAGLAALYLEKCPSASYADFITALHTNSKSDNQTGVIPNFAYGYGKMDGLLLLLSTNKQVAFTTDTVLCQKDSVRFNANFNYTNIKWNNGSTQKSVYLNQTTDLQAQVIDEKGCKQGTKWQRFVLGTASEKPTIRATKNSLITENRPNIQWYKNATMLPNATNDTLIVNSQSNSTYTVSSGAQVQCTALSDPFNVFLGLNPTENTTVTIFPNPVMNKLEIKTEEKIEAILIKDVTGKTVFFEEQNNGIIDISFLNSGTYFIDITIESRKIYSNFIKI